ncbi:MAG: threonine--tRNA ligase [Nanobdellota archaeon]
MKISFPDGSEKEFDKGITPLQIARSISEGLARNVVVAKVNGELHDLNIPIDEDSKVELLKFDSPEGKDVFWHSAAHLFAQALLRLYPEARIAIGPSIDEGFHYDFELGKRITPDDLPKIEEEMKKITKEKLDIKRKQLSKEEALEVFKDNKFKKEMISGLDSDSITVYQQGEFIDFCRGPHLPNTSMIKAFKLTKIAGAYWKASSDNEQLQRVYGIAFPDKKDLKEHIRRKEEAEKRDHRKLGRELDLYSFHQEAPGMPFFHDKGQFIWNKLAEHMEDEMKKRDYEMIKTPMVLNKQLWLQSGHWNHYRENMYFTNIDEQDYAIKPMNCPAHVLVYNSNSHSYRDLPIRMGEFGIVHRHELSGVLSGLFRVRFFTQDDAHVFCTRDQMKDEIKDLLDLVNTIYKTFGFEYGVELSTKPEKAMGVPELWDEAETVLKESLNETGKDFSINEGDGAFYGPKIDFHLKDAIGRTWQCGTIQLDFQMPEKFDLVYEGSDGKKHRPVMLHRAIYGSFERFLGILVEHYAGKFPLWISPNQVKLMPIADRHLDYAKELRKEMKANGLRVSIDDRSESMNKKVRDAQSENCNLMLTLGDKEKENGTVSVRTLDGHVKFGLDKDEFLKKVSENINGKKEKIEF